MICDTCGTDSDKNSSVQWVDTHTARCSSCIETRTRVEAETVAAIVAWHLRKADEFQALAADREEGSIAWREHVAAEIHHRVSARDMAANEWRAKP